MKRGRAGSSSIRAPDDVDVDEFGPRFARNVAHDSGPKLVGRHGAVTRFISAI